MSVVICDGSMRLDLAKWDAAEMIGVCDRCAGPIGGWPETALFFVDENAYHWHHLDEIDALDCDGAVPMVGHSARFEGRAWCGGSGTSFLRSWARLAGEVDRWTRESGQPVDWSGVWRDDAGRVVGGMRGEVAGCVHVAHRSRCGPHSMTSCGICHACPSR